MDILFSSYWSQAYESSLVNCTILSFIIAYALESPILAIIVSSRVIIAHVNVVPGYLLGLLYKV